MPLSLRLAQIKKKSKSKKVKGANYGKHKICEFKMENGIFGPGKPMAASQAFKDRHKLM